MLHLIFLGKIILLVANIRHYLNKRQIKRKDFMNISVKIPVFLKRKAGTFPFDSKLQQNETH
jgi:hypothetical protein